MSAPTQPQRCVQKPDRLNSTNLSADETVTLDFTTLLPTPQQIETFNSYSTGNTPTSSPLRSEGDTYSPPMSASSLPDRPLSEGQKKLIKWLDSLTSGMDMTRKLGGADFARWKAFLQEFSREEFCGALLYAAGKISKKWEGLRGRDSFANVGGFEEGEEMGFLTGMPLVVIPWDAITEEKLGRMSTMEVKSGILQACKTMHVLDRKMFGGSNEISRGPRNIDNRDTYDEDMGGDGSRDMKDCLAKSTGDGGGGVVANAINPDEIELEMDVDVEGGMPRAPPKQDERCDPS